MLFKIEFKCVAFKPQGIHLANVALIVFPLRTSIKEPKKSKVYNLFQTTHFVGVY